MPRSRPPPPAPSPRSCVQVDDEIEVGKPLAEIDPNGGRPGEARPRQPTEASEEPGRGGGQAESNGAGDRGRPPTRDGKATTDDASVSAGKALEGGGLEIVMPEMGESVTEGTVLEWHVSEGDQIAEGDTVVEVSTDKVDAEVPAPASGTITKILVGPDETIEVGKPLAEMTKGDGPHGRRRSGGAFGTRGGRDRGGPSPPRTRRDGARATPWPAARPRPMASICRASRAAAPGGKITKSDVLSAEGDGAGRRRPLIEGEAKPLRGPRPTLARAMNESRSIPTATSFRELAVDTLDAKRKALNEVLKERGHEGELHPPDRLGDRQGRAGVAGDGAAHYEERDGKPTVSSPARINLGIAVDVERKGQRSLLVPCIKGADGLDFAGLPLLLRGADHQDAREQASPPTTSRAPTSASPTPAGSARSPRCRA